MDYLTTELLLFRDKYFETIFAEVFRSILHEHSEHLAEASRDTTEDPEGQNSEGGAAEEDSSRIKFDYSAIATLLFESGSQASVNSKRRKRLYGLSKK